MEKPSREDRLAQKQQAKLAKAEEKAALKAEKAAAKEAQAQEKAAAREAKAQGKAAAKATPKAERKSRRKGAEPAPLEPVTEAEPIAFRPRLELVVEPGPVKHLHWEAEARARRAAEEARDSPAPEPQPEPAQEPPGLPERQLQDVAEQQPARDQPVLAGRRRTLYTTEHGNQVVAYERGGSRQLALTEQRGGRLQEIPFDEAQVDQVIGATDEAAPLQETVVPQPPAPEEPKRRGFWRRKEAPAAPATPVVEHVYRPVAVVQTLPVAQQEQEVDAWEPDGAPLQQVSRAERPRTVRPAPRKAPVAKPAPRKVRRRAARAPQRIYPGDNHPVIDIEGIGPVYAKKLERMGITTTGLLNVAKPRRVAARLQVPLKTVKKWQAEAELIKVRGIGPQFAEALARAGVTGIDELKRRKADEIAKQVAKYLARVDQTVVGQPVTAKRIARWKRKAQPMRRVKVNAETLAVPTHGIPPPWLREEAGKKAKKAGRKTARKTPKTSRRRSK
jgi:predicted flap endonuclease-1-like 5' DNA nuclease